MGVAVLDMYHNYAEIVELILEVFRTTVVQQVVYLTTVRIFFQMQMSFSLNLNM